MTVEKTYTGLGTFIEYAHHRYGHSRNGRPKTCIRCGVQRRTTKDSSGKLRPDAFGVKRRVAYQYRPPCSKSWQYENLPCSIPKGPPP